MRSLIRGKGSNLYFDKTLARRRTRHLVKTLSSLAVTGVMREAPQSQENSECKDAVPWYDKDCTSV